jgi:4'-phosphopantetheinyl transferase
MAIRVDVWAIRCPAFGGLVDTLAQFLETEEQSRADRFYRNDDRAHYVISHAALRVILGRYAGMEPSSLRFSRNSYGKPALLRDPTKRDLRFNLSHSRGLTICAVTRARELGVDIEKVDPSRLSMDIAERFFSVREIRDLRRMSGSDRVHGFYNCWTRKEAYIKGRGEGLSIPLKDFDVSLESNGSSFLLDSRIDSNDLTRWNLRSLQTADGFVSALAVESYGESVEVAYREFVRDSVNAMHSNDSVV